jgi:hypothetical protein
MYNLHNNRTTSRLVDISNFLLHLQDLLFITLFRVMSISGFSRTKLFYFLVCYSTKKKKMPGNDPHRRFNRR